MSSMSREESMRLLNIKEHATPAEINKAYKEKIRNAHPDKGGDPESAKLLNMARQILLKDSDDDSENENWDDFESEPETNDNPFEGFELPSPTLSKDYKILYENSILQFSTANCINNFSVFYTGLVEEGINEMEKNLRFKSFYCKKCKKHFVDPNHHFDQVILPYVQMVTESKANNIYEHIKEALGNEQNFEKSDFATRRDFWESSKWKDLLPIIEHITTFTKELQNSKLASYSKYLDMDWSLKPFEEVNNEVLSVPSIDILSIQLESDGNNKDRIPGGKQVLVDSKQINLKISLGQSEVPIYRILFARDKNPTRTSCFICENNATQVFTNCEVCGELLCPKCFQQKIVLCMGFNSPAKICKPCGIKSDEHDAVIWAMKAFELLTDGKSTSVVRNAILIANQYCKSLPELPTSVRNLYSKISFLALSKGEAETFILIKFLQGVESFGWANVAYQLTEVGSYSYALFCLKLIQGSEQEAKCEMRKDWELMGDWMGKHNAELAMFCYRRCNFKCLDWIEKAEFYDARAQGEDKALFNKLIFLCLEKGLESYHDTNHLLKIIEELFMTKESRLGLYALVAAHLDVTSAIAMLKSLYLNTKEVVSVILVLNYLVFKFPKKRNKLSGENVVFCTLIQQQNFPNIGMVDLMNALDNVKDVQSTIPLVAHLKGHKDFKSWTSCVDECIDKKQFQSSIILLRYAEICEGNFPKSAWEKLGLKITEKSQGQSEVAVFCFLSGGSDVNLYINRFIEKEQHNLAILLCLEIKNYDLLLKTGYKLSRKSKLESAYLYFGAYVHALELWDQSLEFKIRNLQELISAVFGNEEHSDVLLKLEKSLLKSFRENIFCEAAFPAHIHILKHELQKKTSYKLLDNLNACLHFLPETEGINETKYKTLLNNLIKEDLHQAYSIGDFLLLEHVLLHFLPTDECIQVVEAFLRCKLGKLSLNTFQLPQKAVVLLVQGALEKVKGSSSEMLTLFENAMDCYPQKCSQISNCVASILLDDFNSHEKVLHHMLDELTTLRAFLAAPFFWNFEALPILAPNCCTSLPNAYEDNFKNLQNFEINYLQKLEKASKLCDIQDIVMAFMYCDIASHMQNPATITGSFLMAAATFLKVLKESKIPAEAFALQNLIFDLCHKAFKRSTMNGTSYIQTYTARMVFSILLRANKAASIIIKNPFRWRSTEDNFELIPLEQRKTIHSIMKTLLTLGISNPFLTTRFSSITDLVHMDCMRMQFFARFFKQKCLADHLPLSQPKYIYYMYLYDGISKGWFTQFKKEEVKEAFKNIFLNKKKPEDDSNKNVRNAYLRNAGEIDNELVQNRKKAEDAFEPKVVLNKICNLKTSPAVAMLVATLLLEIELQKA